MARYNDRECAYCGEELGAATVVGQDWRVYCSPRCAQAGEELARAEVRQLMRFVTDRHSLHTEIRRAPLN